MFALARTLGVNHLVDFIGNVAPSQMGTLYEAHDLVVVPSHYESFCQVALEALVADKRLLVSDHMAEFRRVFPEVPSCDPTSPSDMAKKICDIAHGPTLSISEARFEVFDWNLVVKQHYCVYSAVRRQAAGQYREPKLSLSPAKLS
jgi:D-inositol-3-phosphate glycosyltransferase